MDRTFPSRTPLASSRRGFTITELLVAIGIIVLLIGILLPALGKVLQRAKATQTASSMQEFSKACDAFQQEFGFYPGLVPEDILANDPKITGTENAILHLCGGGIDQNDPLYANPPGGSTGWTEITFGSGASQFKIKVNPSRVGTGPRIAGKEYPPFFAPKASELTPTTGQVAQSGAPSSLVLPDLLDAWGQPIIYLRGMRETGPLVGNGTTGQYALSPTLGYVMSSPGAEESDVVGLGDLGKDQAPSLFRSASNPNETLAQILRNPAFGARDKPLDGTPAGRYVLISAGPDGVYYSKFDGLGTPAVPKTDIVSATANPAGPEIVSKYDDVRVFGGG
jgi:prepilin-type N-terminal cleavage/methylation domain-containing protein